MKPKSRLISILFTLLCVGGTFPIGAEEHHDMSATSSMDMMISPGGVPHAREASGTSWQPDSTPMHAYHTMFDDWMVMTHFNAFFTYDKQWSRRGDDQFNSINWLMLMASH